jgi:hypothetical protein
MWEKTGGGWGIWKEDLVTGLLPDNTLNSSVTVVSFKLNLGEEEEKEKQEVKEFVIDFPFKSRMQQITEEPSLTSAPRSLCSPNPASPSSGIPGSEPI